SKRVRALIEHLQPATDRNHRHFDGAETRRGLRPSRTSHLLWSPMVARSRAPGFPDRSRRVDFPGCCSYRPVLGGPAGEAERDPCDFDRAVSRLLASADMGRAYDVFAAGGPTGPHDFDGRARGDARRRHSTRSPGLRAGAVPRARLGARASYPAPAGTANSRHAERPQPAGAGRRIRRPAFGLRPEWRARAQASAVPRLGASSSLRVVAWTGGVRRGPGRQLRDLRLEDRPESDHHPSVVAPALGHPNGPAALGVGRRSQGRKRAPETRPDRSLRLNRAEALAAHDPGRAARGTDESLGKEIPIALGSWWTSRNLLRRR